MKIHTCLVFHDQRLLNYMLLSISHRSCLYKINDKQKLSSQILPAGGKTKGSVFRMLFEILLNACFIKNVEIYAQA